MLQDALEEHEAQRMKSRVVRSDDASHIAGIQAVNSAHFHSAPRQTIQSEEAMQTDA